MLRSHYAPARPVALSETLQSGFANALLSRTRRSPCKALLVAAALRFCCVSAGAGYDERSCFAVTSHRSKAADFVAAGRKNNDEPSVTKKDVNPQKGPQTLPSPQSTMGQGREAGLLIVARILLFSLLSFIF